MKIAFSVPLGLCLVCSPCAFAQQSDDYIIKGKEALEALDHKEALSHFAEAVRLDPNNAVPYYYRGITYGYLGQWDKTISDCTEAIRLDPKFAKAFAARGAARFTTGDKAKAIEDVNQALAIDPNSTEALAERARISAYTADYARAVSDYERVIQLDSKDVIAYLYLSRILAACADEKLRNGKKALEYANKGLALVDKKHDFFLSQSIAASYAELGEYEDAVKWQKKAIANIPAALKSMKASAETRLGLYEKKLPFRFKGIREWMW